MENFHWEEYWDSIKKNLRETYSNLKDEDLQLTDDSGSLFLKRLAHKLGIPGSYMNEVLFLHLLVADEKTENNRDLSEFVVKLKRKYYSAN